jgi:nitroimidazol reductase NimA-like FMN-containing flavoprotein (pyridoxamine 5'-phosphate oxidase superfamily)
MTPEEFDKAARYWTEREAISARMPREELQQAIDAFLGTHGVCALATASSDLVRCTPLEYAYRDGRFWIFSEGGLKFHALKENQSVCLAVFNPSCDFGKLESVQVTGTAEIVDPMSREYERAAEGRGLAGEVLERMRTRLHLIEVTPVSIDYLCSALRKRGLDARQRLDLGE